MRTLLALAVAVLLAAAPAAAREGLHARPTLVLDPGFHTAPIRRADAAAGVAVTASHDKTVRVFDLDDGRLLRTIRLPAGPGDVGKAYAVAIGPDGELVAAGGVTGPPNEPQPIYLFDLASGDLFHRIDRLPEVVHHLAFSPDGRFLAAALGGANGLRVFDRARGWAEVARDPVYGDSSYGVAWAPGADARLATTSYDGRIRLYRPLAELAAGGHIAPAAEVAAPAGSRPFGLAFRPDGAVLAVGYDDTRAVSLLDARTLAPLDAPDTAGLEGGDLGRVAWSADGAVLFAGGRYHQRDGIRPVITWADGGAGARRRLPASADTIMSLVPLAAGDLLTASADPWLARLAGADGVPRWRHGPPQADLRAQHTTLAVGADGGVVDFDYDIDGPYPARFDVAALALTLAPPADDRTAPPVQDTLPLADWVDEYRPTLDGAPLPLEPYERSRSLAVHPAGDRFVLGTEWYLRAFDAAGEQLWRRPVPGVAWAVNVTGDGRLVVAAYGDGTIRWHRMDDGAELLAFFPLADRKNWVLWTPDGFYAATPGARGVLRWHVNRGWDQAAKAMPVENMPLLHRPDALRYVLQERDVVRALGLADLNAAREQIVRVTGAAVAPGARLHVLAVGVADYGAAAAHLNLEFADEDARDVAAALTGDPGGLYAEVRPQLLRDEQASKLAILRGLDAMARDMARSEGGRDLAVVFFSGHGAMVNDGFYLLPHGVNADDPVSLAGTGLALDQFRRAVRAVAEHGRVLLLLDACRAGAATADGRALEADARLLRRVLADTNVSVLTSSRATELSREYPELANGAFTEALLDALGRDADADANGLLSLAEITDHLAAEVPRHSDGRQRPGIEMRFSDELFAAGL